MGESYIATGGYFSLNLNAGSDPDVTEMRVKLFQGSIVRDDERNFVSVESNQRFSKSGSPRVTECGRSVKKSVESR